MTSLRTAGLGTPGRFLGHPLSPALGVWWPDLGYRKTECRRQQSLLPVCRVLVALLSQPTHSGLAQSVHVFLWDFPESMEQVPV